MIFLLTDGLCMSMWFSNKNFIQGYNENDASTNIWW
jgi:hypothetical protein